MRKLSLVVFLGMMVMILMPREASAISAWARKYDLDCSVCHAGPMYKLTPVGADFLRRGHRMSQDEIAKEWAKLFAINTKLRAHDSNAPGRNSTFEAHAFSIYTGGPLSSHFSYFTEMYLYENTGKTAGAVNGDYGRSKLADAYLQWVSHPNRNVYTSVKFGQISSSQSSIYLNTGPRYTETRPYIANNSTVPPNSFRLFLRNFGAEVSQTVHNFHGAFGVLNGTGTSATNSIDNNEHKDVYGTLDYILDKHGSAAGVFGYKGRGLVSPATGPTWQNDFHRLGAFGQFTRDRFNLTGAVTEGEEQVSAAGRRTRNRGFLVEIDCHVSDKLALFTRYDYFDPNRDLRGDSLMGPVYGFTHRLLDAGRITFEYHKQGKPLAKIGKPWEYRLEVAYMF